MMDEDLKISIMNKLIEVVCNSDEISWNKKGFTIASIFKEITDLIV